MAKEKDYNKEHVYKNFARRIGCSYKDSEEFIDRFFDMVRYYIDEYGYFHYKEEIQIDSKVVPAHEKILRGQIIQVPEKIKLNTKLMSKFQKMFDK